MIDMNGFRALMAVCMDYCSGPGASRPEQRQRSRRIRAVPHMSEVQSEDYNGPKARIAVAQFKDKTGKGWWTGQIGDGMADQLTTALFNTNRYIVLERAILGDVLSEQDLGASGRVRSETAAPIGQIEGAELLVVGAVTEFEGNASGAQGGLGGYGGGILGGILGGFRKAHMAIDMRIIDTRTSRVLGGHHRGRGGVGREPGRAVGRVRQRRRLGWRPFRMEKHPDGKGPQGMYQRGGEFRCYQDTPEILSLQRRKGQAGPHPRQQLQPLLLPPHRALLRARRPMSRVNPATLNVRSGPGTNYSVVFGVKGGDRLQVLESSDKWIRIRTQDGKEGWTAGWLTSPAN